MSYLGTQSNPIPGDEVVTGDDLFTYLVEPPFSYNKQKAGPKVFPHSKQYKEILGVYINNAIAKAESRLQSTFSNNQKDIGEAKLSNALSLYESNDNIQLFVMYSFYLLRIKKLHADNDFIPIELLVLQKLGLYTSLIWLDQPIYIPEESKFVKLFPKAAMRLKNSLGTFPFFIKEIINPGFIETKCACRELDSDGVSYKENGHTWNTDDGRAELFCGRDMTKVGGTCYEVARDPGMTRLSEDGVYRITSDTVTSGYDISKPVEASDRENCEAGYVEEDDGTKYGHVWVYDGSAFDVEGGINRQPGSEYTGNYSPYIGDWSNYKYECIETQHGEMYSAEEQKVVDSIADTGTYVYTWAGHRFGFYDDSDSSTIDPEVFKDQCDHLMPWSLVFRNAPSIPLNGGVTNFTFEHYKTKWNDEYPETLFTTPKQFLIDAGLIKGDTNSLASKKLISTRGLATRLQEEIWNLYEKDSDLRNMFTQEVIAFGMKLLSGSLFVPRKSLAVGHNSAGYTVLDDPLMPSGAPVNATLIDVDLFGTFTTKCIDPQDRKYIEDEYYRFRNTQRNK